MPEAILDRPTRADRFTSATPRPPTSWARSPRRVGPRSPGRWAPAAGTTRPPLPHGHPLARAVFEWRGRPRRTTRTSRTTVTGQDVPILVNSAPFFDGTGNIKADVAVFQDISPLRNLDRQKDEFLAAISHDLKTPATIIKGNANLLQRANDTQKGRSKDRESWPRPRRPSTRARPSWFGWSMSCST